MSLPNLESIEMEECINKEKILDNVIWGKWNLDFLSRVTLKKFEATSVKADTNVVLELKKNIFNYYCGSLYPTEDMFCDLKKNNVFSSLVIEKIGRDATPSEFTIQEKEKIKYSLNKLQNLGSGYSDFMTNVTFVKVNGNNFKSASNPHLLGFIILTGEINYESEFALDKTIIHELAHQELFLINFIDRLILENADGKLEYSPYQKRNRPPIGRLHSFWAIYRMIQYSRISNNYTEPELSLFLNTYESLGKEILTDFGQELIRNARINLENNI